MRHFAKTSLLATASILAAFPAKPQSQGEIRFLNPYVVEGLRVGGFVNPNSPQYKRYNCHPSEQYRYSTWCKYFETRNGQNKSLTIMHLSNNIATYVNKDVWPATFEGDEIEREVERLSKKFHAAPRVFKSPDRPGGSVGVIVTWGGIELRALGQDDLATIAQGRSANRGILVDYLMDPKKSARVGFPVYGLAGGAGFVWIAGADERGEGHLRFFAADPSAMTHFEPAALETPQEVARPAEPVQPSRPPAAAAEPPKEKQSSSGTGFFVSSDGHIVTNAHVVTDCAKPQIVAGLAPPVVGRVLARDVANDLALLKGDLKPAGVATLRAGARIGEQIGIFGYPLVGLLSTKGNFTEGNVSAVAGMRDDTRFLQISAPVQPGNSGGPALDQSGNVIGVVVAKLDAIKVAAAIQDVPQNVNFAIKTTVLINFLDSNGVSYATGVVGATLPAADLAERGKSISALIVCEQ